MKTILKAMADLLLDVVLDPVMRTPGAEPTNQRSRNEATETGMTPENQRILEWAHAAKVLEPVERE